jgi:hypothetical protein
VEVLAGVYDVDVIALGRWGTTRVRLASGEDRTITVTAPSTAGIDIETSPNRGPRRHSYWHSLEASL